MDKKRRGEETAIHSILRCLPQPGREAFCGCRATRRRKGPCSNVELLDDQGQTLVDAARPVARLVVFRCGTYSALFSGVVGSDVSNKLVNGDRSVARCRRVFFGRGPNMSPPAVPEGQRWHEVRSWPVFPVPWYHSYYQTDFCV